MAGATQTFPSRTSTLARTGSSSSTGAKRRDANSQTRHSTAGAWGSAVPAAAAAALPSVDAAHSNGASRVKKGPSLLFGVGEKESEKENKENIHPLKYTWEVYFSHRSVGAKGQQKKEEKEAPGKVGKEKESREEWEGGVVKLGGFSSVESFHPFFAHLTPPSQLPASIVPAASADSSLPPPTAANVVSDLNIFRAPIAPVWEDAANAGGGRWVLRLRKGVADRVWEAVVFALVGERISGREENDRGNKVNGVVLSVRRDEDILSLWCASTNRVERDAIRDSFKSALEPLLTPAAMASLQLDYKPHPVSSNGHQRNGDSTGTSHREPREPREPREHHNHGHHRERTDSYRERERTDSGNGSSLLGSERRPRREGGGGFSSYRSIGGDREASEREPGTERRERSDNHGSRPTRERDLTWGRS